MNGTSFIKEIGRSYLVSSFLPAALFLSVGKLIFRGFIPQFISNQFTQDDSLFSVKWAFFGLGVVWAGFTLYSSVDWIVKLYEGYWFPQKISDRMTASLLKNWHQKKTARYREFEQRRNIELTDDNTDEFMKLKSEAVVEIHDIEQQSPLDATILMPTRLGNILRASEIYPIERYSLEGISLWPRLFPLLPPHFVRDFEEKNNHLIFLLNSSLLSYGLGAFCVFVGILRFPCQLWNGLFFCSIGDGKGSFFTRGFSYILPSEYIFIGAAFILAGYFLYRIAVNAAIDYTMFVRSAFDLYRFELLKQINHPLPKTLEQEKQIWSTLNEFFIVGNRLRYADINFKYKYGKKKQ